LWLRLITLEFLFSCQDTEGLILSFKHSHYKNIPFEYALRPSYRPLMLLDMIQIYVAQLERNSRKVFLLPIIEVTNLEHDAYALIHVYLVWKCCKDR
jgi:hypothetical protein